VTKIDAVIPIHPDDVLLFDEIRSAMQSVAKEYKLPLKSIQGFPMPESGMADRLGDCSHDGHIRLVMRCTVNGEWCSAPLSPKEIWDTAAHELAHLRHFNHGIQFREFELELQEALSNRNEDHRQKLLKKLVKIQNLRESEAQLGNTEAAESFAAAINRMLVENELNPSDIDYARAADHDPVIEVRCDPKDWVFKRDDHGPAKESYRKKTRVAWQESLARIVANGNLCTFLVARDTNVIWFVGTKSHATVASYIYSILVPNADYMSDKENYYFKLKCNREGTKHLARGFRGAWLDAFVKRVEERLNEERKAAVRQAAADVPGGQSQALMRLSGALLKAQKYVEDKFTGKKNTSIKALGSWAKYHRHGTEAGRAAADRMPIGRRGMDSATERKKLGE